MIRSFKVNSVGRIEKCSSIRKRLVDIFSAILDALTGKDILQTATVIEIVENRTAVFESELERDALVDFAVYRQMDSGKSKKVEYIEANTNIDEEKLLKEMVEAETTLFEVTEINRKD